MTEQKLRERLNKHRAVSYRYKNGKLAGLVNTWFYQEHFILTWEECKDGDQHNEDNYTRDDVLNFPDVDALFDYLRASGVELALFSP